MASAEKETEDIAAFLPEPIKNVRGGMISPVSLSWLYASKGRPIS
jgi:adenosylmethionine-8-amino-7-oxononanoate aminotransferase